jgi:hypothetical protein
LAVGIQYATRTPAGWTTSLVDFGQRWDPSIVLDANGAPHIAYYRHSQYRTLWAQGSIAAEWHGAR